MTILVTGGAGFIGSNFVIDWLDQHDERVINVDKLTYAGNLNNLSSVESNASHVFVKGDIGDVALLKSLLSRYKPRAIINFAAESHVDRSIHGPEDFMQTIEHRQGLKIACPEEIAFRKGWINEAALTALAQPMLKNGYGQYLMQVIKESDYESH